jgi:Domain of unknown function (DUF397)
MSSMNTWRKSSYSGSSGNDCVEVAKSDNTVLVRDTANRAGAVLAVPADAWHVFAGREEFAPLSALVQVPSPWPADLMHVAEHQREQPPEQVQKQESPRYP